MIFPKKHYGAATVIGTAITLSLSAWVQPALSFSLVIGSNGLTAGINNLSIGGQFYNVSFYSTGSSFVDVYGFPQAFTRTPTFWQNPTGAAAATQAIIDALGTTYYTDVVFGDTGELDYTDGFLVPYDFIPNSLPDDDFILLSYTDNANITTDSPMSTLGSGLVFTDFVPYTIFTPVTSNSQSVPEPFMGGALLGLSSLALLYRRRSKVSQHRMRLSDELNQ